MCAEGSHPPYVPRTDCGGISSGYFVSESEMKLAAAEGRGCAASGCEGSGYVCFEEFDCVPAGRV